MSRPISTYNKLKTSEITLNWINKLLDSIESIFNENKPLKHCQSYNLEIIATAKKISHFLKENHILIDEYYDFLEIKRLLKNSLKNESNKELKIISRMIEEFKELTYFKYKFIGEYKNESYVKEEFEKRYEEFSNAIFALESEYYTIVNKKPSISTGKYNELMKDEVLIKYPLSRNKSQNQ